MEYCLHIYTPKSLSDVFRSRIIFRNIPKCAIIMNQPSQIWNQWNLYTNAGTSADTHSQHTLGRKRIMSTPRPWNEEHDSFPFNGGQSCLNTGLRSNGCPLTLRITVLAYMVNSVIILCSWGTHKSLKNLNKAISSCACTDATGSIMAQQLPPAAQHILLPCTYRQGHPHKQE